MEKGAAGTLTLDEANRSTLTAVQRETLLDFFSSSPSVATWGGSDTIPTPQATVFKTVEGDTGVVDTVTIPASLNWKAEVILGTGVTVTATDNTINEFEIAYADPRVDGQAHPAITFNIPNDVKLRINYTPLA